MLRDASTIERVAVEALLPYVANARTHSDDQIAQIAASGASAVTLSRDLLGPEIMDLASISGTIADIAGTLSRDGGGGYSFTRDIAGTALVLPASTPFRSEYDLVGEIEINVWWMGRNDPLANLATTTTANVAAAIAHLKTKAPRWLLVGVTTKALAAEASGTSNYSNIVAYNNAMKAAYGDALASVAGRVFDVRRWLIDHGPALVAEQGLTWTASDDQCIAWDTIPTTLMAADLLHMTDGTHRLTHPDPVRLGRAVAARSGRHGHELYRDHNRRRHPVDGRVPLVERRRIRPLRHGAKHGRDAGQLRPSHQYRQHHLFGGQCQCVALRLDWGRRGGL